MLDDHEIRRMAAQDRVPIQSAWAVVRDMLQRGYNFDIDTYTTPGNWEERWTAAFAKKTDGTDRSKTFRHHARHKDEGAAICKAAASALGLEV